MNRRDFLKTVATSSLLFSMPTIMAENVSAGNSERILVLVELKGGNDGLNTLIPYKQKEYYEYRPQIAIAPKDILKLDNSVGMHPALQSLMPLWQQGDMAWIQGVGYPMQDRSHFHSIEIWETGKTDSNADDFGWVSHDLQGNGLKGVSINSSLGPFAGSENDSISIKTPEQFARQGKKIHALEATTTNPALKHILGVQASIDELSEQVFSYLKQTSSPKQPFPNSRFGKDLHSVYSLITGKAPVPAYKVSLGSFDTHTNQLPVHQKNLTTLSEALAIFAENLQAAGFWDNVLIMTYSEFGRRVHENANQGTDHGAAASHFALGGKVKGGLHGQYPSLADLDERGDLKFTVDFRDIYATILQTWWGATSERAGRVAFV